MKTLGEILGGFLILVAVGVAVVIVGFSILLSRQPNRIERIEIAQVDFYQQHAEGWVAFCDAYRCEDIPAGQVIKSINGQSFMLPHISLPPMTEGDCEVRTDSRDHTEYQARTFQRGASLNKLAFTYYLDCGRRIASARNWEDRLLLYKGKLMLEEPGRNNAYSDALGSRWSNGTVSYQSRLPMLRDATPDFREFKNHEGIYLSNERLFQGRFVALICSDRCEMLTINFLDEPDLDTPHLSELIQFRQREGCEVFEALHLCRPDDWHNNLASIARYIQFLNAELEAAKVSPLAGRE